MQLGFWQRPILGLMLMLMLSLISMGFELEGFELLIRIRCIASEATFLHGCIGSFHRCKYQHYKCSQCCICLSFQFFRRDFTSFNTFWIFLSAIHFIQSIFIPIMIFKLLHIFRPLLQNHLNFFNTNQVEFEIISKFKAKVQPNMFCQCIHADSIFLNFELEPRPSLHVKQFFCFPHQHFLFPSCPQSIFEKQTSQQMHQQSQKHFQKLYFGYQTIHSGISLFSQTSICFCLDFVLNFQQNSSFFTFPYQNIGNYIKIQAKQNNLNQTKLQLQLTFYLSLNFPQILHLLFTFTFTLIYIYHPPFSLFIIQIHLQKRIPSKEFALTLNNYQPRTIMEQQQQEILQTCKKINEQLEIDVDNFSLEYLQSTQWYLEVLQILYPSLEEKLRIVKSIKSPANALDQLLKILAKQEIIQEDFLQIKGKDIIQGDIESIYYVVQLLNALVDREIEQQENEQQEQEGQNQNNSQTQEQNQSGLHHSEHNQRDENKAAKIHPNSLDKNEPANIKKKHDLNLQNNFRFDSESDRQQVFQESRNSKEAHSVLGIQHQFEESDQQDQESNEQQLKQQNFLQPQKSKINVNQNNMQNQNIQNVQNIQSQKNYKDIKQAATGYKMKLQDQDEQEEDQNEYFINNPSIKKYKSDDKMATMTSNNKKTTTKKKEPQSHAGKQLISHPTIKKQYRKAANPEAKKLAVDVMRKIHHAKKKKVLNKDYNDPMKQEMRRKNRQLKIMAKDFAIQRKVVQKAKIRMNSIKAKSNNQLQKVLNWKQGQLKKQKKQFQQGMQMKIQIQKQQYIKKINQLILQLQKEKEIQERNDYKENIKKQNKEAAKKLLTMQKWYKDKLDMLRQKKTSNRDQRKLLHTGHKQILKQIEKQLKRQNQKQILHLTMKYKKNSAQIQNDLEQLTSKIIQVYKKN